MPDSSCSVNATRHIVIIMTTANQGKYYFQWSNAMRILFLDLDTLRPDHLGCYGYQRNTSPTLMQSPPGGEV